MITFTLVLITMFGGDYHEMRVEHIPTIESCQAIMAYYKHQYRIDEYDHDSVMCIPVQEILPVTNIRDITK